MLVYFHNDAAILNRQHPDFFSKKTHASRGISLTLRNIYDWCFSFTFLFLSFSSFFSISSVFRDTSFLYFLTSSIIRFHDVFSSLSLSRAFLLFSLLSLFLALPPVFSPTPAFTSRLWILLSNTYIARTAIRTLDDVCVRVCRLCACTRSLAHSWARARARVARRRTEKCGFSFWRFLAFAWQQSEIGASIDTHW